MRITRKTSLWVAAAAVLTSLPAFAGEGDVGVARITDATKQSTVKRAGFQACTDGSCAVAPSAAPCGPGGCSAGNSDCVNGSNCQGSASTANRGRGIGSGGWSSRGSNGSRVSSGARRRLNSLLGSTGLYEQGSRSRPGNWWRSQVNARRARSARASRALSGMFCPSGNCGQGAPPFGHYNMVYAADPNHFDHRDGSLYSAQGYGTPVTVPLAPNVHHQFNYGWGMPSSRITQISTPAGYSVQRPVHW